MTTSETCALLKCTTDQLSTQYAKNAEILEAMYNKAIKAGKKINGYTAEQLDEMTKKYYQLAADTLQ